MLRFAADENFNNHAPSEFLFPFLCPHSSAIFLSAARTEHWQRNGGRGMKRRSGARAHI